jgi:hypothetical protein
MSQDRVCCRRWTPLAAIVLLTAAFLLSGCSLYSDLKIATRDRDFGWGSPDPDLKRKIVFAPVNNRVPAFSGGFEEVFKKHLVAAVLDENPDFRPVLPSDPEFPEPLRNIPEIRPGLIDNLAVADAGRGIGANAVVVSTIYDISTKEELRGFLLFKAAKNFIQFTVGVSAFDMETCAKIFDRTYQNEIEIDEFELETARKDRRIQSTEMENALQEAAEELAEQFCEQTEKQPWKSFVLTVGDTVKIAAGSAAGLKEDDRLDVCAPGQKMAGIDGQVFFLPGKRIAQVRLISVTPETAAAEVISQSEEIAAGYTVRTAAE